MISSLTADVIYGRVKSGRCAMKVDQYLSGMVELQVEARRAH